MTSLLQRLTGSNPSTVGPVPDDDRLRLELRERFGHPDFRPGQIDVVRAVLAGKPTLAVMPTGSGKSLCYQLPSLLLPGVTLVVSPLVSLMKDQVDQLGQRSIPAAYVNSSQPESVRAETERGLAAGRYRLIYVAPERFRSPAFRRSVSQVQVSLLAIDEAHCISEWGHAFRPDYERLGEAVAEFGAPRVLALTATATRDVRSDIVRALRLRHPVVVVTGFDRPNIHLEVHELASEAEKRDSITAAVKKCRPAIVYANTRRQAMTLARTLVMSDVRAAPYHAGLELKERQRTQEGFFQGDYDVVTATNAFGLGIDKRDVRLVLHAAIPRSIEAYYQEIGRAGRDGADACAGMFFVPSDIYDLRRLLNQATPPPALVEALYSRLASSRIPVPISRLAINLPGSPSTPQINAALAFLESLGSVERHFSGPNRTSGDDSETVATATLYSAAGHRSPSGEDLRRLRIRSFRDRQRLEHMVALARRTTCRRAALLRELGEPAPAATCEGCDICAGARLAAVRSRLSSRRVRSEATWAMSGPATTIPVAHEGLASSSHAEPM
jgi:ATP-dependent DNA helicase RecQ